MSNPALAYEREMVPALFGPWATVLIQAANPRPGERVLDLACGTGIVAREAAARIGVGQVVGLDVNPNMLAVARSVAERAHLRIDWHEGRAEQLPFVTETFDLVLCQQGLQFVPDKASALAEIHRVLRPRGRAAVSLWLGLDHHPFFRTMNDVVFRHVGVPALASPFSFGDAGELEAHLRAAGFSEIVVERRSAVASFPDPDGFIPMEVDVIAAAIPSMQHLDASSRKALADAIAGEMEEPIREVTRDGHIVIPFHAHVARATKAGPART